MTSRYALRTIIGKVVTFAIGFAVCIVFAFMGALPTLSQAAQSKAALNLALLKAAGHNRGAEVKSLLAQGADPNVKVSDSNSGANGYTPIMLLAMRRNPDVTAIQALQKAGGDINAVDVNGMTALMHSSTIGSVSEIRVLLVRGAKIDLADSGGETALMTAAQLGWDEIVRLLLDHGAKIDVQNRYGQTALLLTTIGSHGPSALIKKVYTQRVREMRMLIDKGANVNLKSKDGVTPLMLAAHHGNVEMVKALLKKHADVTAHDAKGRTALQMAMRRNRSQEVIRLLKGAGAKE
jgi:ankyrin repeat protein